MRGREQRRDRRRRAFVDVGRPHVKGHRRDLEGDAREHEHEAEQLPRRHARIERARDARIARGTGEAVHQRHAVEQDAARERAEYEILQPGLSRARIAAHEAGKDIAGERLQLEADVERDEVARRHHHPRADRRQQDEHRILGLQPLDGEKAWRDDQCDRGRQIDQRLGERREGIGAIEPVEGRAMTRRRRDRDGPGDRLRRELRPAGHQR